MVDCFTPKKRSAIMSRVGHFDTPPERAVRSALQRMGYRFRLHRRDLPGNPDIVLPRHKKIIFVHGCFWHGHTRCRKGRRRPASNVSFWKNRIDGNVRRDHVNLGRLRRGGWRVLVIWECQVERPAVIENVLKRFLQHLCSARVTDCR